jgi:extradiol dioxygenase family protein
MRELVLRPFHLAIPVHDLAAARGFYGGLLGCAEGRSAADWVDFDFFGHQLVCHLDATATGAGRAHSLVDGHDVPVPHFGVVLALDEWETLRGRLEAAGVAFPVPPHLRFAGQPGEQRTLFIRDPSGNALEFKGFRNLGALFAGGAVTDALADRPSARPPVPVLRGLDHIVLRARDAAALVSFYQRVLGCRVERQVDALGLVQLRAGNALIDIVAADSELGRRAGGPPDPARRNMDHFCLRVESFDETAIRAWLRDCGVEAEPTARRYGADGFGPSIYLRDPEGNVVELKGRNGEDGGVPG